MFLKVRPENMGVKSEWIYNFINQVEKKGITMHDVLIMRGDKLIFEAYWKPFNKDFLHREYSQTKSFVSVAIGLLEEEGKLSLDDKISDYFKDKIERKLPEYMEKQTIRDMLKMTTCCRCPNWFYSEDKDRVHLYFNSSEVVYASGTCWDYDSAGSQVLCVLVERISGMSLLEYLKQKLFNKMGFFKDAYMLRTPTGESWGDSAMICRPYDMLAFGRLVLNYGMWNGQRLMNEKYLREATSAIVYNNIKGQVDAFNSYGYGYQIWRMRNNSFAFVGMGQQLTICNPEKDIVFVCNGDTQGAYYNYSTIINMFFDEVVEKIEDDRLEEDEISYKKLNTYCEKLELRSIKGQYTSEIKEKINNKIYVTIGKNKPMITELSLSFDDKGGGVFRYTNLQGKKELPFSINKNCFCKFPQYGYSDNIGGIVSDDGYLYDCAVSGAWMCYNQFQIYIQVIDKYFGNCTITFGFKEDKLSVIMEKTAENFFDEYSGCFSCVMKD